MAAHAEDFPQENLNEDVEYLRIAWSNELNSPELLSFQSDLISDMVEQVQNQQSFVDEIAADTEALNDERAFTNKLYQMEIDRIKYMIASYLRLRLMKIEQHTAHVLKESKDKLSQGETEYAEQYQQLYESHCKDLLLSKFPDDHNGLNDDNMVDKPELDTFVFCQSLEDNGNIQVDDRGAEHVNARKDDRHVLRYRAVAALVDEGKMKLL
ncbi:Aste57867_8917 [Aphanomyces stellatus]|uniref:DNA replication complex GINS protein SLD5 n=1 Tax=Aphanomyces stellatus TaxID=120398 RepID=A0A485KLV0_9STRA|nr:hypothetical protein As57867_008882 [Aphanomyces stellatus]VFT85801.1 Aste57867_8917 [Aphanomyces stellatus]